MYLWTLYANPDMEYDLAPPGRPAWVILMRAAWFHAVPVIFQWIDLIQNKKLLQRRVYAASYLPKGKYTKFLYYFWMAVGGYFAMGLTWEHINGDAAGTYQVKHMSPEIYVAVSKVIGVVFCAGSFLLGLRPAVLQSSEEKKTKEN
jgi:hypothetical protein